MNLNAENVCLIEIELQDERQLVSLLTGDAYKEFIKKATVSEVKKTPVEEAQNLRIDDIKPTPGTTGNHGSMTLQKSA